MAITVVVDYQNVYRACENKVRLDTVFGEIMRKAISRGEIHEFRLFAPCYQSAGPLRLLNALQRRFGLEVSCCLSLGQGTDIRDTVDFEVQRWVMRNIYPGVGPDTVVFVTGDSHFVVSSNEVKRRGKEAKFWFIDSDSVSRIIREEENFELIKIAPPILPSGPNPFLATLEKIQSGQPLNDDDRARLEAIGRIVKQGADETIGNSEAELFDKLSRKLDLSSDCVEQLLKALMVLDIVRIYPSISTAICVDSESPLFQWVSTLANAEVREHFKI